MVPKRLWSKICIFPILLLIVSGIQITACQKNTLQGELFDTTSSHLSRIKSFTDKYHSPQQDLTIVLLDGSISTDMGYASKRADSAYRPPCLTETNIPSFIEEKLRFKGQQYRRYDALKDPAGGSPVFVESGSAVTQQFDAAWDWQNKPAHSNGYNGMTRILSGPKPSVSYQFPAEAKRSDFIYRTDYLSSSSVKVSIGGNANQIEVFDEAANQWKEAEGYTFSAKEKDELIPGVYYPNEVYGATSLRKSIYQKRLKMRAKGDHGNLRVSITSQDGGRLCYWGITYSPLEYMFQFINSARGGHNISELANFESWSVDYWKPDLILYSCNTINEGADASAANVSNSPVAFADRFDTYIRHFLAKPYRPNMFAYILFTARAHGLVNSQDQLGKAHITNYGEASVFDFINELDKRLVKLPIASASAFQHYWDVGESNAKDNKTRAYAEFFGDGGGPKGSGFLADFTHLNDNGALVGWEYLRPLFNF